MSTISELICIRCQKAPHQLAEYIDAATADGYDSPAEYVWDNEGTLNRENGHYACTDCYIAMGMPSSRHGWVAP